MFLSFQAIGNIFKKNTQQKYATDKGFSIIEILIAAAIISSVGIMSILSVQLYLRMSVRNSTNMQAALLFEETSEIILFLRDESWEDNIETLDLDTDYYLDWNGTSHITTTTEIQSNNLTRSFSLSEVLRDSDDKISETGNVDPDTLLVNINVSWEEKGEPKSLTSQMLIHNTYDN